MNIKIRFLGGQGWVLPALACSLLGAVACESTPIVTPSESSGGDGDGGDGDNEIQDDRMDNISFGGDGALGGDGDQTGDGDNPVDDAVCGNGVLEPSELCDDGNTEDGDGCEGDCQSQDPHYDCSEPGEPCVNTVICGNGVIEGDEACDDGGEEGGDGCSADCSTVADGYVCARPGVACVEIPECGNGERERGEECDDGDDTDENDGCHECAQAEGFFCVPGEPCVALVCGDGNRTPDETCDDGSHCADGTTKCTDATDCVDTDGDDGKCEPRAGDGCSAECEVESGWRCGADSCVEICGDGIRVGSEVSAGLVNQGCDDGDRDSGDGCSAGCLVEPYYNCDPGKPASDITYCTSTIVCGNGEVEPGEVCDEGGDQEDGIPSANGCRDGCTGFDIPGSECGNGDVEPGEFCEPGVHTGCDTNCEPLPGYACPTPDTCAVVPFCGDGILDTNEDCDDGTHCADGSPCDEAADCALVADPDKTCAKRNGDGCSTTCAEEGNFVCTGPGPSLCVEEICGDGVRTAGEGCDDGAQCGDLETPCDTADDCIDVPGDDGTCLPRSNDGCTDDCNVETGWSCPTEDEPCIEKCGDSIVVGGESCDDGSYCADGTTPCTDPTDCTTADLDDGFCLPREGDPRLYCADGTTECTVGGDCSGTTDDDGECLARHAVDGCNTACQIVTGFGCAMPGQLCAPAVCGNGTPDDPDTAGVNEAREAAESGEGCDDGNTIAGDGCSATCQNEPTVDRTLDTDTPTHPEPRIPVVCGDGLKIAPDEACDDGNTLSNDGCSSTCQLEGGFTCEDLVEYPAVVNMGVTYRDFKNRQAAGGHPDFQRGGGDGTDPLGKHCKVDNNLPCTASPGAVCAAGTCSRLDEDGKPEFHQTSETGKISSWESFAIWYRDGDAIIPYGVEDEDSDTTAGSDESLTDVMAFQRSIPLQQDAGDQEVYRYNSSSFYPLTDEGFGNYSDNKNYHFTTELRYFFQYKGGETLIFSGDDDVWVYVNGRLAVDIGGVHTTKHGRVVLGDDGTWGTIDRSGGLPTSATNSGEDSNCSEHRTNSVPDDDDVYGASGDKDDSEGCYTNDEIADDFDDRFGLEKGKVYEIVLFQAERQTVLSNFNLTLAGFIAPRTSCTPICGDGLVRGYEVCDHGTGANIDPDTPGPGNADPGTPPSDLKTGQCNATCSAFAYCGDGVKNPDELCDDGSNSTLYTEEQDLDACAPGCTLVPYCGDGLQPAFEECDFMTGNQETPYGPNTCTTSCTVGPYCGDGEPTNGEICDEGVNNGRYNADPALSCTTNCEQGPYCGDGERNGDEECDDENDIDDDECSNDCKANPFCGDGNVAGDVNNNMMFDPGDEECDYGLLHTTAYGGCTEECRFGPRCGDGSHDMGFEECDLGDANEDGVYGGCSTACLEGPRCGDGELQTGASWPTSTEQCDNGFNQDVYAFNEDSCGVNCTAVPFCGDGNVDDAFELCDDGDDNVAEGDDAYDACTDSCEYGPFCGDGELQSAHESCDNGAENTAYSPDGEACGYDCQPAPYCGDGERNGPEECDDGTAENTGGYGKCKADCTRDAYCGDGVKNGNEFCDDGPTGSLACSPLCTARNIVQ